MPAHASHRALRAFLEVARRGGVAPAARRLGVTPSAVSHLMRELEAGLGLALFRPGSGRAVLSEAGERLLHGIGEAFDAIERAVAEVAETGREGGTEVRVSTLSTFATLWLVPRLPRLQRAEPALRVLVATDTRPVDLAAEPFDCAIRWGTGPWPGLEATPLLRERLVAVAGPALPGVPVAEAAALLRLPRIAARSRPEDWPLLLAALPGGGGAAPEPALVFQTRALAVRAAIAGLGVAVVDEALVGDMLRDGHLARAAPVVVPRPESHVFVARPQALRRRPALRRFRDWLVAEAAATPS
jgi:LysR family glycine cleavage system transcriptional activator